MRSPVRSPLAWAIAGLLMSSPVLAADTTTFNVTLVVTKACTITAAAATNVDFGTAASTTATPTLGQGTVTAQCSALTPYTISLNAGANASTANAVTTRRMKNTNAAVTANNYVGYQLYQDAAHTLVWGATTGTNTQAGIGTGLAVPYIVYGQILNLSTNNPATARPHGRIPPVARHRRGAARPLPAGGPHGRGHQPAGSPHQPAAGSPPTRRRAVADQQRLLTSEAAGACVPLGTAERAGTAAAHR
ncbi:hypothetical protein G6F64_013699 [Rhizopus arrhizus]|uniref:Spore coat protein U/FanG domain-containing protein n=1 Tax=Rhizopus oryzae TaxID=64495 RepID=A0A9P7BJN6_RHIOR|nr:hypothetical protein G6F64_013699 [Rhizopus arrhizus]